MEVAEELRKALAVKNREGAEKDAEIARLQKRCALLVVPGSETLDFAGRFKHVEKIALGSSRRHTKALHSLVWNAA